MNLVAHGYVFSKDENCVVFIIVWLWRICIRKILINIYNTTKLRLMHCFVWTCTNKYNFCFNVFIVSMCKTLLFVRTSMVYFLYIMLWCFYISNQVKYFNITLQSHQPQTELSIILYKRLHFPVDRKDVRIKCFT